MLHNMDHYVIFITLSMMSSTFIHVTACMSISFLYMARSHTIVWIYPLLFIHSLADKHLGYFHFLAFMNDATNIYVQGFVDIW